MPDSAPTAMPSERRNEDRALMNESASIRGLDQTFIAPCVVCNISDHGAKLLIDQAAKVPGEFILALSANRDANRPCHVVWRIGNKMGVRFPPPGGTAAALRGAPRGG